MLASTHLLSRTLAQAGMGSAVGWLVVMLVAVIAGAVALFILRRRLLDEEAPDESQGLTLHDLRQMHQRGDLSAEEFEAAKRVIVGSARAKVDHAEPARNPLTGEPRERRPGRAPSADPLEGKDRINPQ